MPCGSDFVKFAGKICKITCAGRYAISVWIRIKIESKQSTNSSEKVIIPNITSQKEIILNRNKKDVIVCVFG